MDITEKGKALFRFYDCDTSRPSTELLEAIERHFEYTIGPGYAFEFSIREADFYSILSVVDAYNAPILAQLGFETAEEVTSFLRHNDLSYLILNNTEKTATAQRLRVPAGVYMDCYMGAHRKRNASAEIIKGLETYAQLGDKKPYCRKIILPLLVSGSVRYSDVETIGYGFIEHNREVNGIASALVIMKTAEGKGREYTAEDIKRALTGQNEKHKEWRLKLVTDLGAEAGFQIDNLRYICSLIVSETQRYNRRVSPKLAMYVDTVYSLMGKPSETAPIMMLRELYAAGVAPEVVAEQFKADINVTVTRIIALHEGAANALTEGWL